jgi:hypothetical protein
MKHPGVPTILLVVEGAGVVDGQDLRPGKSYYWAAADDGQNGIASAGKEEKTGNAADEAAGNNLAGPALSFTVDSERRGPLKVAIAHQNLHLDRPTAFNRQESMANLQSSQHGLMPYMGMSPSPGYSNTKRTYASVESGTPSIPTL